MANNITVTESAELAAALATANPGDTIKFGNSDPYTLSADAPLFAAGTGTLIFSTNGSGTTITDAVKLTGAKTAGAVRYQDIAHGALA